jgi:hypothetical protein
LALNLDLEGSTPQVGIDLPGKFLTFEESCGEQPAARPSQGRGKFNDCGLLDLPWRAAASTFSGVGRAIHASAMSALQSGSKPADSRLPVLNRLLAHCLPAQVQDQQAVA